VSDARVPMDPILGAFGVPATVTRPAPDDTPIETTGVWISPLTADAPGGGFELQRRERRYLLVLDRDTVPTVPRGTRVEAPERLDGTVRTWRVDSLERVDTDETRVWVIPVEDET